MLDLAAYLFQTVTVIVAAVRNARRAPITSVVILSVLVALFWALAISWIDPASPAFGLIAWPVAAMANAGLEFGAVFTFLVVAAIPIYGLWSGEKPTYGSKKD